MSGKSNHEYTVATEFTSVIDTFSIEITNTCLPPEPDLKCSINGNVEYLEIARLLDAEAVRFGFEIRNNSLKIPPLLTSPHGFNIGLPERDVLTTKFSKQYRLNGYLNNLLLYYDFDAKSPQTFSAPPPFPIDQFANDIIIPIIKSNPPKFNRIWLFDRRTKNILWEYISQ